MSTQPGGVPKQTLLESSHPSNTFKSPVGGESVGGETVGGAGGVEMKTNGD